MIIVDPEQSTSKQMQPVNASAPLSFGDGAADRIIVEFAPHETYASPGGEEPPPFTLYAASHFTSGLGDVVSHDPHLNDDGEALYRFLLSQASVPPCLVLHCRGSHAETHTRLVPEHRAGRTEMTTETYTEKIIDFDFKIDVTPHIMVPPTHWSLGDSAPAYRGRMVREVGIGEEKRRANRAQVKAAKAWDKERSGRGYPPWIGNHYAWREDQPHVMHNSSVLKSSWTLRQWADDYCASKRYLKEFVYHKVVYGWDFDAIKAATRSAITSTHYTGDVEVDFQTINARIFVRSENKLSQALSSGWVKFILFITLIYPFLWLFKRFHSRGGGKWEICGGAYPLKRIEWVNPSQGPNDIQYSESPFRYTEDIFDGLPSGSPDPSSFRESQGRVVGVREGVWFRQWEGRIRMAVLNRLQDSVPLDERDERLAPPVSLLDGY